MQYTLMLEEGRVEMKKRKKEILLFSLPEIAQKLFEKFKKWNVEEYEFKLGKKGWGIYVTLLEWENRR